MNIHIAITHLRSKLLQMHLNFPFELLTVHIWILFPAFEGFPGSSVGKESACNAGDPSSIPGLGRSIGEGIGYPLQYSGLENSMDCIVHGVAESDMTEWLSLSLPLSACDPIFTSRLSAQAYVSRNSIKDQLHVFELDINVSHHVCPLATSISPLTFCVCLRFYFTDSQSCMVSMGAATSWFS